jgi:hypothetical protein
VSTTTAVEVSVPTEDLGVSVSTSTLPIRRGSMSTPVTVSATSLNGLSGTAQFQCIGLPAGMTCAFAPNEAPLVQNGTATTSLVISAAQNAGSAILVLLLVPVALGSLRSRRVAVVTLLASLGVISACGDGGDTPVVQHVETATIQVAATVGAVTRTVTVTIDLQ